MSFDLVARTAIWIFAVAFWIYLTMPGDIKFPPAWAGIPTITGGGLIAAGLGLYVSSAVSLARAKRNSLGVPEVLLTCGPYRYVRNPLYLAIGMLVVGVVILYQAWHLSVLLMTLVLFVLAHLAVVFLEESPRRARGLEERIRTTVDVFHDGFPVDRKMPNNAPQATFR